LSIASNIINIVVLIIRRYSFITTLFLGPFDDVITKFYCIGDTNDMQKKYSYNKLQEIMNTNLEPHTFSLSTIQWNAGWALIAFFRGKLDLFLYGIPPKMWYICRRLHNVITRPQHKDFLSI
jgi:hypothetical protein